MTGKLSEDEEKLGQEIKVLKIVNKFEETFTRQRYSAPRLALPVVTVHENRFVIFSTLSGKR